jgi:hypothetical protein
MALLAATLTTCDWAPCTPASHHWPPWPLAAPPSLVAAQVILPAVSWENYECFLNPSTSWFGDCPTSLELAWFVVWVNPWLCVEKLWAPLLQPLQVWWKSSSSPSSSLKYRPSIMISFLQRWPEMNFSSQLKHKPWLLSCILAGVISRTRVVLDLVKLVEGKGGTVSPWVRCHVSIIGDFFKLQFFASNNQAYLIASVAVVGLAAWTSAQRFSFKPLTKHPSWYWVDRFPT